jgi:Domain of unknown function (DUF4288)
MAATITGLERFGLTSGRLAQLGACSARVDVHLRTYEITSAVAALEPAKRQQYLLERADRWLRQLRRWCDGRAVEIRSDHVVPSSLTLRVPAGAIGELARQPAVRSVHVAQVAGRRPRRAPPAAAEWHCVRARVAIQIEGAVHGMQTVEDRFVLVRARSPQDAIRRLRREWREYARPYLNRAGKLVRWHCEAILDVQPTGEVDLNPNGTEIYSKLSGRRMRPEQAWQPRSSGRRPPAGARR